MIKRLLLALVLLAFPLSAPAQTLINSGGSGGTPTVPATVDCGVVTVSTPCWTVKETWNNGATVFGAPLRVVVTDTASAAGSHVFETFGGAAGTTSLFSVDKAGMVNSGKTGSAASANYIGLGQLNTGIFFPNVNEVHITASSQDVVAFASTDIVSTKGYSLGASTSVADVFLRRDAANILAQRNGATAQASCWYNTFTDPSNYERVCLRWASSIATLTPENAGSGSSRLLTLVTHATAVASLPTCNAAAEGARLGVTDALTPVSLSTVVGGGAVHVPVYCNGTNWIVN